MIEREEAELALMNDVGGPINNPPYFDVKSENLIITFIRIIKAFSKIEIWNILLKT